MCRRCRDDILRARNIGSEIDGTELLIPGSVEAALGLVVSRHRCEHETDQRGHNYTQDGDGEDQLDEREPRLALQSSL
jgi:hypothetical protein